MSKKTLSIAQFILLNDISKVTKQNKHCKLFKISQCLLFIDSLSKCYRLLICFTNTDYS